jgi:hypothetical protein
MVPWPWVVPHETYKTALVRVSRNKKNIKNPPPTAGDLRVAFHHLIKLPRPGLPADYQISPKNIKPHRSKHCPFFQDESPYPIPP